MKRSRRLRALLLGWDGTRQLGRVGQNPRWSKWREAKAMKAERRRKDARRRRLYS